MNNPDRKANFAFDALMILLALALLCFITRLWPILLLIILGIFIAALRLAFLSAKPKEEPKPSPAPQQKKTSAPDLDSMIFAAACQRVEELVRGQYPNAKWVWEQPDAKRRILNGEPIWILLNQAGGYRRARVHLRNLKVNGLDYPLPKAPQSPQPEPEEETPEPEAPAPEPPENYDLLAFEWVEAHILELNDRCNEAIGKKRSTVLLKADELPKQGSWPAICAELAKQDITDTAISEEGIWIRLDGGETA